MHIQDDHIIHDGLSIPSSCLTIFPDMIFALHPTTGKGVVLPFSSATTALPRIAEANTAGTEVTIIRTGYRFSVPPDTGKPGYAIFWAKRTDEIEKIRITEWMPSDPSGAKDLLSDEFSGLYSTLPSICVCPTDEWRLRVRGFRQIYCSNFKGSAFIVTPERRQEVLADTQIAEDTESFQGLLNHEGVCQQTGPTNSRGNIIGGIFQQTGTTNA